MQNKNTRSVRRVIARAILSAAAASAFVLGGAGVANAAPAPDEDIETHRISSSAGESAEAYWTPERMEAATPADRELADPQTSSSPVAAADPVTIDGVAAASGVSPELLVEAAPVSHIGKVFFTLAGQDYVCSGNSVVSANESTVATAGHCLNEGPGAYATNFVFAPAYDEGATPYGVWSATELVAPTAWVQQGDINYDTGFAVVSSGSGATLSDTVGASGVAFNQPRGLEYTAYGYPAASPFDGESLHVCSGAATSDTLGGTDSQGIPCDMTGGSSGGPWFIGDGAGGVQNSVNSFGYNVLPGVMFGPFWGSVVQSAYDTAAS
ncbi:hypothetical protein N8K70_05200 [Microbacterium betulae]|uniref:Peptidase n=1 Tax=Microbacterium betulae TaxID=2981139 RepID=A0AA97I824_9MICO|nr:hypothetical protein [Microbacterium sp. AB]WOF24075.1 hypothetical protein N8K70_05200 [Microbacterium sp. AB]